jgi:hypothetical protein
MEIIKEKFYSNVILFDNAYLMRAENPVTPSFLQMFPLWFSTVLLLMKSSLAISLLDLPSPISRNIFFSEGVSI